MPFKLKNKETGLYWSGGNYLSWSKSGKLYDKKHHLKTALNRIMSEVNQPVHGKHGFVASFPDYSSRDFVLDNADKWIIEEFTATKEHGLDFIDIKPTKINFASLTIIVKQYHGEDTLIVFGPHFNVAKFKYCAFSQRMFGEVRHIEQTSNFNRRVKYE